jgi:ribonuclease-3
MSARAVDIIAAGTGYRFTESALVEQAFRHGSVNPESGRRRDYERLEFLGDRVLSLVVAELLLRRYPDEREGEIARRHAVLVNRATLAGIARKVGIGPAIEMSASERQSGGAENPGILADVLEAVLAAIYLDGGLEAARGVIAALWETEVSAEPTPPQDAKTKLQEWAQARGMPLPEYRLVARTGPDHAPAFRIEAVLVGGETGTGEAGTKKAAEQAAARALLDRLLDDD